MSLPRHPRIAEPTLARYLPPGSSLGTRTVRDCLKQISDQQARTLSLSENGQIIATLSVESLQKDLIDYYEKVFHELELDRKIMFLQGTYSC